MSWWLLLGGLAHAERPTDGGSYAFDDSDVVATYDGPDGLIRVTYSADGPNAVRAGDDDGSGVPDFVEEVAASAELVLEVYEANGFRLPLSEADMGLDELGGSPAFDVYLVDFAGVADGWFSTDRCRGGVCSGYFVMENDFRGYGYPSISEAIRVLTSHELFHAVQAAYNGYEPDWLREGTAVWAEYLFDPENQDFIWFSDAYLEDAGRSLNEPPAGAISSFTYGTALFWAYLVERFGVASAVTLQEQVADRDEDELLNAVEDTITAYGGDLAEEWVNFARWNLATGDRAGLAPSYPFAAELEGVAAEGEGASVMDLNRFYPLATTYYRLDHDGGALYFATGDDPTGLVFSLHPVAGGASDGPVEEPAVTWAPDAPGVEALGELERGGYWLVGTYPQQAENSVKIELCLGSEADVAACLAAADTADTGDTGDTGDALDTGKAGGGGCACASTGAPHQAWPALLMLSVALTRRPGRRRRA